MPSSFHSNLKKHQLQIFFLHNYVESSCHSFGSYTIYSTAALYLIYYHFVSGRQLCCYGIPPSTKAICFGFPFLSFFLPVDIWLVQCGGLFELHEPPTSPLAPSSLTSQSLGAHIHACTLVTGDLLTLWGLPTGLGQYEHDASANQKLGCSCTESRPVAAAGQPHNDAAEPTHLWQRCGLGGCGYQGCHGEDLNEAMLKV